MIKYYSENILLFLVLLELLCIFLCPVLIFYIKAISDRRNRKKAKIKSELISQFKELIIEQHPLNIRHKIDIEILIETIEYLDNLFSSDIWKKAKQEHFSERLLSFARKNYQSLFWKNRHLAARTFLLFPAKEDVPYYLAQLHDRTFFIRIIAVKCLTLASSIETLREVLLQMTKEPRNIHTFYSEVIRNGGGQMIEDLKTIYQQSDNMPLKLMCLKILSDRTHPQMLELIHPDLNTTESKLRYMLVKILMKHPNHKTMHTLLNFASDPEADVRAICCEGLSHFSNPSVLKTLNILLADSDWNVRLKAALALKMQGPPGKAILEHQDWDIDKNAYEAARYVLTLP